MAYQNRCVSVARGRSHQAKSNNVLITFIFCSEEENKNVQQLDSNPETLAHEITTMPAFRPLHTM